MILYFALNQRDDLVLASLIFSGLSVGNTVRVNLVSQFEYADQGRVWSYVIADFCQRSVTVFQC
jgi:hypothetical protein